MRIAYLAQSYPPMVSGAALFGERLAKDMAQRGHQVLVIAASDRDQPYITLQDNLRVLRLKSIHNPLRVGQRFLFFPRYHVKRALEEFQPDIIHSHEPLQMGLLGLAYSRRAGLPITLTVHQLPWFIAAYLPNFLQTPVEKSLWSYARWLLKRFTSVIAPTKSISTFLHQMTGLQSTAISSGLDLNVFHPPLSLDEGTDTRQRWNLPPRVPILLHVGRLDTDKHADRVILAAAQAMQHSDAHLVMVGDGRQKQYLVQMCRDLKIEGRVHFTGYVSVQQGLPELYRSACMFVTASEIETQGIVLLEAAASGLPLVAVHATCIAEIVYDGANGYLTNAGDVYAMSQAMVKILADPHKAASMGSVSRTLAEGHPNQATFDEHERMYQQMILEHETQMLSARRRAYRQWTQFKKRLIRIYTSRF